MHALMMSVPAWSKPASKQGSHGTERGQYRPLLQAIERGDVDGVKSWLAEAGHEVSSLLQANPAPLNHAVFNNNEEIVCLLLEKDALGSSHLGKQPIKPVGRRFEHHPLRSAVEYGHLESVRALLRYGATIEPDMLGTACATGRLDIAELLVSAGADVDARPEAPKPTGRTPLMQAAAAGNVAAVIFLLKHGASPNLGHDEPVGTALSMAERAGHDGVVALLDPFRLPLLVDILADIDAGIDDATPSGSGALQRWLSYGGEASHRFMARMEQGRVRMPLLVYAAMQGNDRAVSALLKSNALVDATMLGEPAETASDGQTALMRAAMGGFAAICEMLLAGGADPTLRSATGETALFLAEARAASSASHEAAACTLRQATSQLSAKRAESRSALSALAELRAAIDARHLDGLRAAIATHAEGPSAGSPQVAAALREARALREKLTTAAKKRRQQRSKQLAEGAGAEPDDDDDDISPVASDISAASTLEEVRAAVLKQAAAAQARVAALEQEVSRANALAEAALEATASASSSSEDGEWQTKGSYRKKTAVVASEEVDELKAKIAAQAALLETQAAALEAMNMRLAQVEAAGEASDCHQLAATVGALDGRLMAVEATAGSAVEAASRLDRAQQARAQEDARTKHFFVLKQRQQLKQQQGLCADFESRVAAVEQQLAQLASAGHVPAHSAPAHAHVPMMAAAPVAAPMQYHMAAPQQWQEVYMTHPMAPQHHYQPHMPAQYQMAPSHHHVMAHAQMHAMSQQQIAQAAHHGALHPQNQPQPHFHEQEEEPNEQLADEEAPDAEEEEGTCA
mmetsp:Transcript_13127/g.43046  ORF Transcript_13127/g.43046 Transcript_13127/m.43046 type:complete len:806 (+) Transcript_13127:47-2464(+)